MAHTGVAMQPGRRLAERYRLERPARAGLWIAHDEVLARPVVIAFAAAGDPKHDTFRADALALARISHPHIVATYDTGVDGDGTAFRVDELLDAEQLSRLRNAGTLSPHRVVSAVAQVARALEHAHAHGLAHGHLTGDDVLVTDDDRVKLCGLGTTHSQRDPAADVPALVSIFQELGPAAGGDAATLAARWADRGAPTTPAAICRALLELDAGPDDATPMGGHRTPPAGVRVPRRRGWLPLVVLTLLAGGALALAASLLGHEAGPQGGAAGQPVSVVATSFDPEARPPTENESSAGRAVDGDASSTWSTERYRSRPFAGLKDGVGLILRASDQRTFTRLEVESPTNGWAARVYVADQPATSLAGWGEPVAQTTAIRGNATFALGDNRGRAVLLWITDTGAARRAVIAEVRLEGRP